MKRLQLNDGRFELEVGHDHRHDIRHVGTGSANGCKNAQRSRKSNARIHFPSSIVTRPLAREQAKLPVHIRADRRDCTFSYELARLSIL